jgi:hypothetical protein
MTLTIAAFAEAESSWESPSEPIPLDDALSRAGDLLPLMRGVKGSSTRTAS